ncbi:MAG: hypothetical protein ACTSUB_08300 [Candidatus Thorarchaeota archaeon]
MTSNAEQSIQYTTIRELTPQSHNVSLIFKVLHVDEPRRVTARRTGKNHLVAKAVIADSTAKIDLILWNFDVDEIKPGNTYTLTGGRVEVYEEAMQLAKSRSGEFSLNTYALEDVNPEFNMSRPFIWRKKKRKRPRSKTGRTLDGAQGKSSKGYCSFKEF